MYIPSAFAEPDTKQMHDFMVMHSFATLVSASFKGLIASHLPLILDREKNHLLGHMARANPQWRDLEGDVMAVFHGPHAYISPSWYEAEATVPTWNYVTVHAYGKLERVEGSELIDILYRSVDAYESPREQPWKFNHTEEHVDKLVKGIVGFKIPISRLEGKWKLSQNHSDERRHKVIKALKGQNNENSQAVAKLMEETFRKS